MDQCEDAVAVRDGFPDGEVIRTAELRVAISDGASEAMLAKDWSRMVTAHLVEQAGESQDDFLAGLQEAVESWPKFVDHYVARREVDGKPIQWYEEPGLARGAYATAMTLTLRDKSDRRTWNCVALGDCCMFHTRGQDLLLPYPVSRADDFNNSPALAHSRQPEPAVVADYVTESEGEYLLGDVFYLATDAIAAWILRRCEDGEQPWDALRDLGTEEMPDFPTWVAGLRGSCRLKDDDTTLVRIETQ